LLLQVAHHLRRALPHPADHDNIAVGRDLVGAHRHGHHRHVQCTGRVPGDPLVIFAYIEEHSVGGHIGDGYGRHLEHVSQLRCG
jgi:hypothetical protein